VETEIMLDFADTIPFDLWTLRLVDILFFFFFDLGSNAKLMRAIPGFTKIQSLHIDGGLLGF
jgi:hypothetical protein